MPLMVKPGREYVLGGTVYKSGETVEGVPEKFIRVLTAHKGPLTYGDVRNRTDLPARAKKEPVAAPAPKSSRSGRYNRTDMQAAPVGEYQTTAMQAVQPRANGQTGEAPLQPSSPPDHPLAEPTSDP